MTQSSTPGSNGGSPWSFQSGHIAAFTRTECHYRVYSCRFLGRTCNSTAVRKVRPVVGVVLRICDVFFYLRVILIVPPTSRTLASCREFGWVLGNSHVGVQARRSASPMVFCVDGVKTDLHLASACGEAFDAGPASGYRGHR